MTSSSKEYLQHRRDDHLIPVEKYMQKAYVSFCKREF